MSHLPGVSRPEPATSAVFWHMREDMRETLAVGSMSIGDLGELSLHIQRHLGESRCRMAKAGDLGRPSSWSRMMRRYLCSLLLWSCAAGFVPADDYAEARKLLQHGNYSEARDIFQRLRQNPTFQVAATIGLARTWIAEGQWDKALAELDALPEAPDALAEKAHLLFQRGQWDEADKALAKILAKKPDHFLARWVRAQLFRDRGQLEAADKEMRWFVRTYTALSDANKDIRDAEVLLLVGQAGAENARWHQLSDQFHFIINEVYADALKYDPDLWQAEYLIGALLLEKYNRPDAVLAFDKALSINPKAVEALVGKGQAALQVYEWKEAETLAERALRLRPNDPPALRLRADVHFATGDFAAAEKLLTRARQQNPRDEATLGRIAALRVFQRRPNEVDALRAEILRWNAKPALFHFTLAEALEERRYFAFAETHYRWAMQLRPMLPGPPNALGLLYMRLGREKEAQAILQKAFEADRFHVRVANTLKVLRHLETYQTLSTPHFDIRFDPKTDRLLAQVMADELEQMHARMSLQFGFVPPDRILVEVFNSHEMFSGRTIALPDLHTVGACTGKMIALASPKAQGISRPFDWGRVLRHELTHIFNLAQSDFLVPHWLTEGLAVRNETVARPAWWDRLLRDRVERNELWDLNTIALGFIRPRDPLEWNLAYCQSLLYVEYFIQTYGEAKIGPLLKAFRQGDDTAMALRRTCNVEQSEFEKGYLAYLKQLVQTLPQGSLIDPEPIPLADLEKQAEKNPQDADWAARLAEQYLRRKRTNEAKKWAESATKLRPDHPRAAWVLARLQLQSKEVEAARTTLESALRAHPKDLRLLRERVRLALTSKEVLRATELLERGRQLTGRDPDWLDPLIEIYLQLGEEAKAIEALRDRLSGDPDEFALRVRFFELLAKAQKWEEAEQVARQLIQIDVTSPQAQSALLKALEANQKTEDVTKYRTWFRDLAPSPNSP